MIRRVARRSAAMIITVLLLFAFLVAPAAAEKPSFIDSDEWEVLSLTNEVRRGQSLTPLSVFPSLESAVRTRAAECAVLFEHTRPDGSDCFTALSGIGYYSAGENIAAGYHTAKAVTDGWIGSPGHYKNMVNNTFAHLGVGHKAVSGTPYVDYWAQLFVGGCHVTDLTVVGSNSVYGKNTDELEGLGLMVEVTCDMHGKSYLPLADTSHSFAPDGSGHYTVTVSLAGVTRTVPLTGEFRDVKYNKWYYDDVYYVFGKGLMNGTAPHVFEPETKMSRAMLVTVLWRMEGEPAPSGGTPFTDLRANWYKSAVGWAYEHDIVRGMTETSFAPDSPVTREQIAVIMKRYNDVKYPGDTTSGDLSRFVDGKAVSAYASGGVRWAVGRGIIRGDDKSKINPQGRATRAEVAAILRRYCEMIGK